MVSITILTGKTHYFERAILNNYNSLPEGKLFGSISSERSKIMAFVRKMLSDEQEGCLAWNGPSSDIAHIKQKPFIYISIIYV